MIVKFLLPKNASEPKEFASKLLSDHFCPLGRSGDLVGFVKKVEEREDGGIMVLAEITEPDLVDSITKRYGHIEPLVIDVERMSMDIPLFNYARSRFPTRSKIVRP